MVEEGGQGPGVLACPADQLPLVGGQAGYEVVGGQAGYEVIGPVAHLQRIVQRVVVVRQFGHVACLIAQGQPAGGAAGWRNGNRHRRELVGAHWRVLEVVLVREPAGPLHLDDQHRHHGLQVLEAPRNFALSRVGRVQEGVADPEHR